VNSLKVSDTRAICAPLLERGLDGSMCGGAIRWMSRDGADSLRAVASWLDRQRLIGFLLAYLAALVPFLYVIWIGRQRIRNVLILALLAVPFLPLYPVSMDWGRWMSFHVFSASVLLACAAARGRYPIRRSPSNLHVALLVGLALSASPKHTLGMVWGGTFSTVEKAVSRVSG
jgi:hypothetical protein